MSLSYFLHYFIKELEREYMYINEGRIMNDFIVPNKKQYTIPVYQRNYEWSKEQCKKLFQDIVLAFKKQKPHFCGSFVYIVKSLVKPLTHIDSYIVRLNPLIGDLVRR